MRVQKSATTKRMKLLLSAAAAFAASTADFRASQALASESSSPRFFSFQTHSHLRFPVESDVSYIVEKLSEKGKDLGLKITFKNAGRSNSFRLGHSANTTTDLSRFQDNRTARVVKKVAGEDVVFEVYFSEQARKAGVDFFDYRNRALSEVSVDYWFGNLREEAARAVAKAEVSPVKPSRAVASNAVKKPVTNKAHVPNKETVTHMQGSGDCARPLELGYDEFTLWAVYHRSFDYAAHIRMPSADVGYSYPDPNAVQEEITRTLASENAEQVQPHDESKGPNDVAHYALALKLYQKKNFGLALRTIDFFDKQFPKSPLSSEMRFLRANALIKLAAELKAPKLHGQGVEILQDLALKEPKAERAKYAHLYVLQELSRSARPAQMLEHATAGAARKDENEALYLLAMAESLQSINELERSGKVYDQLMAFGSRSELAAEAAFRRGEVEFQRRYYDDALNHFVAALQAYPGKINQYPTAIFNLAETYFRLRRFGEAREMYDEFRVRFPHDKATWAADLRIPEIDQIQLGALSEANRAVASASIKKGYENVVNKHPYSPGEFIAELRLADCVTNDRSDKAEREKLFFTEFFKKRKVEDYEFPIIHMPELKRLNDLARVRFENRIANYESVIGIANDYRDKLASFETRASFQAEFAKAAHGAVVTAAQQGRYKDALKFDDRYGDLVVKPNPPDYLLAISQAFHGLNRLREAQVRLHALAPIIEKATKAEKDEYYYLRYKNERLLQADLPQLTDLLKQISDDGKLSGEKYNQLASLATEQKDYKLAIEYDSKLLDDGRSNQIALKEALKAHVRRLENLLENNDPATAMKLSDRVLLLHGTHTEYASILNVVRELRARALYRTGQFAGALAAFDEILSLAPEHKRRTEMEFFRAKCLDGLNRENEAAETFRKIATSDKGIWGKSAKLELENKEFKASQSGTKVSN